MTLAASGTLEAGAKIQYLYTLVCGEALRQFDSFSAGIESVNNLNVDDIIKGLARYFSSVHFLFFLKCHASWNKKDTRANCKTLCGASN